MHSTRPSLARRPVWEAFLAPFQMLPHDSEVAWRYGEIQRDLSARGLVIGANDLWIAAVGLARDLPVVTRNEREFARVPGLEVLTYR